MTKYAKKLQNYDKKVSKKLQIVKNFTILRFSAVKRKSFGKTHKKGVILGKKFGENDDELLLDFFSKM